jgi:hypothetical protein
MFLTLQSLPARIRDEVRSTVSNNRATKRNKRNSAVSAQARSHHIGACPSEASSRRGQGRNVIRSPATYQPGNGSDPRRGPTEQFARSGALSPRVEKQIELEARLLGELSDSVKVAIGIAVKGEEPSPVVRTLATVFQPVDGNSRAIQAIRGG